MLDSKMDVLVGILGTFGVLMFIVFAVIVLSAMKSKNKMPEDQAKWLPETSKTSEETPNLLKKGPSTDVLNRTQPPEFLVPTPGGDSATGISGEIPKKPHTSSLPHPTKVSEADQNLKKTETESAQLQKALKSTQDSFWGRIQGLFKGGAGSPEIDDLEEVLYTSDLGPSTVQRLLEIATPELKRGMDSVRAKLKSEITEIFSESKVLEPDDSQPLKHLTMAGTPAVWMVVGINGAGKTTTIGKMSALLAQGGKKVLVAAGDTFRAAAGAQLKVWTERAEQAGNSAGAVGSVEIFHPEGISDPSAVAFDAVTKGKARGYDVVIIDTAGRLQTQAHLMDELKKVKRVIQKVMPEAPHEVLLVLDANNGQNALNQAREFHAAMNVTGVILTKMDGTAKGGVAVGVSQELKVPIRLLGLGEQVGDLKPFSARGFVDSILG